LAQNKFGVTLTLFAPDGQGPAEWPPHIRHVLRQKYHISVGNCRARALGATA
jgi:hypothetical protein